MTHDPESSSSAAATSSADAVPEQKSGPVAAKLSEPAITQEDESYAAYQIGHLLRLDSDMVRSLVDHLIAAPTVDAKNEAIWQLQRNAQGLRPIAFLLRLRQYDPARESTFLMVHGRRREDQAFLRELTDRIQSNPETHLALHKAGIGFPPPEGSPLGPLKARLRLLGDLLTPVRDRLVSLGFEHQIQALVDLINDCRSFAFRVFVIGEFSSGKSTLINALLGTDLLPMGWVPVTPAPTRICYGDIQRLFLKQLGATAEEERPPAHIQDIVLPDVGDERNAADHISALNLEYLRFELPADLCREGIEVYDTPGLNDERQRSALVVDLLPQADAVLWVSKATQLLTDVEQDFIRRARSLPEKDRRWLDCTFMAFTHSDALRQGRGRRGVDPMVPVVARADKLLSDLHPPQGLAPKRRYWINAAQSLNRRTDRREGPSEPPKDDQAQTLDPLDVDFERLDADLRTFLALDRGAMQEVQRQRQAQTILQQLASSLRAEQTLLEQGIKLSEEERNSLRKRIQQIEVDGETLATELDQAIADLVARAGKQFGDQLTLRRVGLSDHLKTCTFPGRAGTSPRQAAEFFIQQGQDWLRSELETWLRTELARDIDATMYPFRERLQKLRSEARAIGAAIGLAESSVLPIIDGQELGVVASMSVFNKYAALGALFGAGVGTGLVLTVGLSIVALPVAFAAGILLGGLAYLGLGSEAVEGKLRELVSKKLAEQIQGKQPELVSRIEGQLRIQFHPLPSFVREQTRGMAQFLLQQLEEQQRVSQLNDADRQARIASLVACQQLVLDVLPRIHRRSE